MKNETSIALTTFDVQSILAGNKSQKRFVIKEQPPANYDRLFRETFKDYGWWWSVSTSGEGNEQQDLLNFPKHRFGKIGDFLWVQEEHAIWNRDSYEINGAVFPKERGVYYWATANEGECRSVHKWSPSTHMPRWASRILLQITDIRVERLHDISANDAVAEGFKCPKFREPHECNCVCSAYEKHWIANKGLKSWKSNPWVWVLSFRVTKSNKNSPCQ